jgi:uncharacterized membrane protein
MSVATSDVGQGTGLFQPSRAATIVLAGLLAGAVLATWVSEVALGRSAQLWITYHQAVTPAYTVSLPPLGALTLIAVLATVTASWSRPRERRLLLGAVACLLVGLVTTAVVHFPINSEIATRNPDLPPVDWQHGQQRWLAAHALRTVLAVAAFVVVVIATAVNRPAASVGGHPRSLWVGLG